MKQLLGRGCIVGRRLLWTLLFSVSLAACGNELTRSEAKRLIIETHNFPRYETTELDKRYIISYRGKGLRICLVKGERYSHAKIRLDQLVQRDLIEVTQRGPSGNCNVVDVAISVTDNGRKYFVGQTDDKISFEAYEVDFGEITGIKTLDQNGSAVVYYTRIARNTTPFANQVPQHPTRRVARFSLFDDGWRLLRDEAQ